MYKQYLTTLGSCKGKTAIKLNIKDIHTINSLKTNGDVRLIRENKKFIFFEIDGGLEDGLNLLDKIEQEV